MICYKYHQNSLAIFHSLQNFPVAYSKEAEFIMLACVKYKGNFL